MAEKEKHSNEKRFDREAEALLKNMEKRKKQLKNREKSKANKEETSKCSN